MPTVGENVSIARRPCAAPLKAEPSYVARRQGISKLPSARNGNAPQAISHK